MLQIARGYLEVLQTEQEINWRRKRLEREALTLNLMEQQVAQGYETRLALMKQENEYYQARLELKKLEDSSDQLRRELAKEIGWRLDGAALSLKPVEMTLRWEVSGRVSKPGPDKQSSSAGAEAGSGDGADCFRTGKTWSGTAGGDPRTEE